MVNLLSNDVNRFDVAVIFAHQLWVGPLETVLVTYLMYQQVGVSAVIGVVFLLMFIPLQSKLSIVETVRVEGRPGAWLVRDVSARNVCASRHSDAAGLFSS